MTHPVAETAEPRNNFVWLRSQFTIQNVVLLVLLLMSLTGWVRTRESTDEALLVRLAVAEHVQVEMRQEVASTYVRRDVLEERLKAVESSLREIKEALRLLGPVQRGKS